MHGPLRSFIKFRLDGRLTAKTLLHLFEATTISATASESLRRLVLNFAEQLGKRC